jgi:hypothetical protein
MRERGRFSERFGEIKTRAKLSNNIKLEPIVSRVQEIAEQVRALSGAELRELRAWIDEYDDRIWDQRFEEEVAADKWDELAEKALQDHHQDKSTPL